MHRDPLADQGFSGPAGVLTPAECRLLLQILRGDPAPLDWEKGRAVTSRTPYEIATRPAVLEPVRRILGRDVVLWGASLATRSPGQVHPPHVDIETSARDARAVNAWIGLENTTLDSALWLIAGSHRLGPTIQEVALREGRHRGDFGRDEVLAWARERDPGCALATPDMGDGDAIWFDGRLWHGSDNKSGLTRTALLLQYAAAATPIRIPDLTKLDWPFRLVAGPRPPCIVVAGEGSGANRLVPPPPPAGSALPMLSSWIHELELPLDRDTVTGFTPHPIFHGQTGNTSWMTCHASTLGPGASPHDPHVHDDEEILIVLDGEGELIVGDEHETHPVEPGKLAYYPAGCPHTLRGGSGGIQYLMFKWKGVPGSAGTPLTAGVHDHRDVEVLGGAFAHGGLLEGPTGHLDLLQCHLSELEPDAGYEAHVDAHDVAIVLLRGVVETLGETVRSPAVVFTSGGWTHGIKNVGEGTARYLVFEFHGRGTVQGLGGDDTGPPPGPPDELLSPVRPPRIRQLRIAVWAAGGRALRGFPRAKARLRSLLRLLSPWR